MDAAMRQRVDAHVDRRIYESIHRPNHRACVEHIQSMIARSSQAHFLLVWHHYNSWVIPTADPLYMWAVAGGPGRRFDARWHCTYAPMRGGCPRHGRHCPERRRSAA